MKEWWINKDGSIKDGWYYIRTWEDMEKEFGLYITGNINCAPAFTNAMERFLPPIRSIKVVGCKWEGAEITSSMIASPAYKIGGEYAFSDDGKYWKKARYGGYLFGATHPHTCQNHIGYRHCRPIQKPKYVEVETPVDWEGDILFNNNLQALAAACGMYEVYSHCEPADDCRDSFVWVPCKREDFKMGDTAYNFGCDDVSFVYAPHVCKIINDSDYVYIADNGMPKKSNHGSKHWYKLTPKSEIIK